MEKEPTHLTGSSKRLPGQKQIGRYQQLPNGSSPKKKPTARAAWLLLLRARHAPAVQRPFTVSSAMSSPGALQIQKLTGAKTRRRSGTQTSGPGEKNTSWKTRLTKTRATFDRSDYGRGGCGCGCQNPLGGQAESPSKIPKGFAWGPN